MTNFSDSGHPIFRASSAFERGEMGSKVRVKKSKHFNGIDENIELLLRTVMSANQPSVYGAIADLCNESSEDLRDPEKPEAPDHLETMEIPTGPFVAETQTNAQQRGNLVQEYERKYQQLSQDQKLSKFCSDAGLKLFEKTEERQQMQQLCREYKMPRNEKKTRVRGWIRKGSRIDPVLNIKVCYHDDRYSIAVQIPSLFQDNTASLVRIVNGVDKYVTESMLTREEEDIASVKHIAKARPRRKPIITLTSVSILVRNRKWEDIEKQRSDDTKSYEVSKSHDPIATT